MEIVRGNSILDKYFDDETLSVHFKEKAFLVTKKGKPGKIVCEIGKEIITKDFLQNLIDKLFDEARYLDEGFVEIDRQYSKVLQIGPFRIVIVLPPLSNVLEMTVVKPIMKLSIQDYNLDNKIIDLLKNNSKGILISGAPGEGKTTFAQALSQLYVNDDKVVKTIESPRDLLVGKEITQYSFSYGSHGEIRDILLLSRPDFTIYDEVRNVDDFVLFKDLRLTGIGLIGVIHATNPVDSIQRLIGTIEMGVIPQVVDTVIFIKAGTIDKILNLDQVVKVPHGMESGDLARPVVLIKDFMDDKVLYEIYSYGEQIVVMPLEKIDGSGKQATDKVVEYGIKYLQDFFKKEFNFPIKIEPEGKNSIKIIVSEKNKGQIIGKAGATIQKYEKMLSLSISVREKEETNSSKQNQEEDGTIKYYEKNKGGKDVMVIEFGPEFKNKNIDTLIGNDQYSFYSDSNGQVIVKKSKLISLIKKHGISLDD